MIRLLPAGTLGSILLTWGMLFFLQIVSHAQERYSVPIVIEIVKFKLMPGTNSEDFKALDRAVELEHVSKQPGFVARESAAGENGEWLDIVHWQSIKHAEGSMASFKTAPAAQAFMSKIDASTMTMERYAKQ